MSSYLLTAKINSLQAELDALYLQVQTSIFASGLTNPLNINMICGPWEILSEAPITTTSSVNAGQINGGTGNFTTSITTPTLLGIDTLTLEDLKTAIIFPKTTGGTITLQGPTLLSGSSSLQGSLTATQTLTGQTVNATGNGTIPTLNVDTLQTNTASVITFADPVTSNYPITGSTLNASGNIYAGASIIGQYIVGGVSVETNALTTDTLNSFNTSSISVSTPITSISNITTAGELSSASLTVSGTSILPTITGGSSNLVNINSGINVPIGNDVKIREALYVNEVRAIANPSYGTVNFDNDIAMGYNGNASTNNVIDIGSLKMRPLNGTARNQDVVIRAPAVPGTTNGAIQVMVPLTNGSDGTYGTVYDTVYNIPPGVTATTLSAVLTAGNTAPTQSMTVAGITTQNITGASSGGSGNYLHCTTDLISDGNISANNTTGSITANNSLVTGYQALQSVINPADYTNFVRATNNKLQVQYGHLVNVPSSSPWGSIYDDFYNKPPPQLGVAFVQDIGLFDSSQVQFNTSDVYTYDGVEYGWGAYLFVDFGTNPVITDFNSCTLTASTFDFSVGAGPSSVNGYLYITTDPNLNPFIQNSFITTGGFISLQPQAFTTQSSFNTNVIMNYISPNTSSGKILYFMVAIPTSTFSPWGTHFACSVKFTGVKLQTEYLQYYTDTSAAVYSS